jgi:hypothetical protein
VSAHQYSWILGYSASLGGVGLRKEAKKGPANQDLRTRIIDRGSNVRLAREPMLVKSTAKNPNPSFVIFVSFCSNYLLSLLSLLSLLPSV